MNNESFNKNSISDDELHVNKFLSHNQIVILQLMILEKLDDLVVSKYFTTDIHDLCFLLSDLENMKGE